MPNVLQITSNYADAFYEELFSSLDKNEYKSTVFVPQKINFDDCHDAKGVIKSQCYSKLEKFFLRIKTKRITDSIIKNVDLSSIDLVHAHSLYTGGITAYKLYKQFGIPYIISMRINDVLEFPFVYCLDKCLVNDTLKHATAIVFISENIKKRAFRFFPVLKKKELDDKCFVVPNKVTDVFYDSKIAPKEHNNNSVNMLFVGRLVKNKRYKELVKYCSKVFKDGDTLSIISPSKNVPTEFFEKYKFVKWVGKVPHSELPKYYREADIFALLSKNETFGISYIESMTQGTPILYSKNDGVDGFFKECSVGYAVKRNSFKDFKKGYEHILNNYKRLSSNCVLESKQFQDDIVTSKLCSIYKMIK